MTNNSVLDSMHHRIGTSSKSNTNGIVSSQSSSTSRSNSFPSGRSLGRSYSSSRSVSSNSHSLSSRGSGNVSISNSSLSSRSVIDANENLPFAMKRAKNNWDDFLTEKIVKLFRLQFATVSYSNIFL